MDFEDTFYGRPNTIKTYQSLYRRHIAGTPWDGWNDDATRSILTIWEGEGLSRNTLKTLIRLLGRYIEFKGGPKVDTQRFIRALSRSEQQKEVTSLSVKQAGSLMEVTRKLNPKFYPVMLLAMHAGLRRGEIFGLRCGDIDMLQGKIKISHSYDGPTKSGRSRLVPMSAELSRSLAEARNFLLRKPSEKVFEQFDPNPALRRLCSYAHIQPIRFHDLRHTFASLALTSGVNPKQVASWLGHSSVVTTLEIYWNLTSEDVVALDFLPEVKRIVK
jgi:integrase